MASPSLPPAAPSAAILPPSKVKGPWERAWMEKATAAAEAAGVKPPKCVRYTLRVQAAFPDGKESYCQALCEGKATVAEDDSGEDDSGEDCPAPRLPDAAEVEGLH
jgi:hypothetical protein